MKKTLSVILSLVLTLTVFAGCAEKPKSNAIEVSVDGHNAPIKVAVSFEGEKVSSVEILEHKETDGIADPALSEIPKQIVEKQSLDIDSIVGATVTGDAIISAVKLAATQAGVTLPEGEKAELTKGEDQTADVVVVGAGLSGIMSTYEIKKLNPELNVVLVEKSSQIGGALKYTGGAIVSNTSKQHEAEGLATTVEEIEKHLKVSSKDSELNDEIIDSVFGLSAETVETLIEAGLPVKKEISKSNPGNDKIYAYWVEGGGKEFQTFMEKFVEGEKLDPKYNTKVTELVVENGAVTGVKVEDEKSYYTINAKAVILATGGFANNDELVKKYIPNIPTNYLMTVADTATGDGFMLTQEFNTPTSGSGTMGTLKTEDNKNPIPAKLIVTEDGNRFSDEKQVNYWIQRDFLETGKMNAFYINVADEKNKEQMEAAVTDGSATKFASLEEMAEKLSMDKDTLLKSAQETELPAEGEYYVSKTVFRSFGTLVGLVVDNNMQLVNGEGTAISGLYGTGELVVSNAFTTRYPGGGFGISFAVNSGRYTGQSVVEALSK